jgi:hypothetical protein
MISDDRRAGMVRWIVLLGSLAGALVSQPFSERPASAQGSQGQWSAVQTWPIVSVHTHLMPNGLILFWDYSGNTRIWNPSTAAITTPAQPGRNTFCSGNCALADGKVFVPGGHIQNNVGLASSSMYNPFTGTWTANPNMNAGRWYPSATTLANGDALVHSGDSNVGVNNDLPQVYQAATNTWRDLTSARLALTLYPRTFLAPDGRVFFATSTSRYLNTSGTGAWTTVGPKRNPGTDNYGPAAMYDVGKILYVGGADPPTANAEVIDLNAPTPSWTQVAPMPQPRRQNNATILPDGKVLVTGGSASSGFNTPDGGKAALLWDPATNTWTTLATQARYRGYHSTATLLPDGRVLSSGGDNEPNAEVFSPPYLFAGARPAITSAPASVGLGQTFFVGTPDGAGISKVTFTAPGSQTHAFDWHQRINFLTFSPAAGGLSVTAPASANVCPPGYYLLWLVNASGVPSVSAWVRVTAGAPPPPPAAPSGLTATAASSSQIHLAWTDNANNETGYRIERKTGATGTYSEIATVGANVVSYASSGLAANTTYSYRVRAFNDGGSSAYSNEANATTQAAAAVPAAPSNLTATTVSRRQINLAWSDNSGDETGFRIERSTDNVTFAEIATTGVNATSYANTGLRRNRRFYYRVRAFNASGNSPYSNTASAKTFK